MKWLQDHWHILSALVLISVAGGVLRADVNDLKEKDQKRDADRDTLIEMRAEQKQMQRDLAEIKQVVKELARANR